MKEYKIKHCSKFREETITADSKDRAIYQYLRLNGENYKSFEEYMKEEKSTREAGLSCWVIGTYTIAD